MQKKQDSAKRQKRQGSGSFLTPDFLRKQKVLLDTKLDNFRKLQKVAREEIEVLSSDERKGDVIEQASRYNERQNAAQRLNECGKIVPQIRRALGLIDNSLTLAGRKSGENYGECINCEGLMSQKRLEAVPWALRCVSCQENEDTKG